MLDSHALINLISFFSVSVRFLLPYQLVFLSFRFRVDRINSI